MTEIGKYKETEMVSSGCQELRKEEIRKQGWTTNGRVSFWGDKNILE